MLVQFDIIMLDVAAPDAAGDPGSMHSLPSQFLSSSFILEGLQRRLRWVQSPILGALHAFKCTICRQMGSVQILYSVSLSIAYHCA